MEHIIKWFSDAGNDKAITYLNWFTLTFEPTDFTGTDALLMCFLKFCSKLKVQAKEKYLESYLKTDGIKDVKKFNIKSPEMDNYDYDQISQLTEGYEILKQTTLIQYKQYMTEDLTDKDFKVEMNEFISKIKNEKITSAMKNTMIGIANQGDVDVVSEKLRLQLSEIKAKYNIDKLQEIDDCGNGEETMEFVCDTASTIINDNMGGVYTRLIYTIAAPPGAGKTQFVLTQFVYSVLTKAKRDVVFYELEMSKTQIRNILISYHISNVFKVKIPHSDMNKQKLDDRQKQIYNAAKIDLFESGKYGKLIIFDECTVETFEDEVTAALSSCDNPAMICIDYMGLIESHPTDKWQRAVDGYEIITEGYKAVRRLVRRKNIAAVCINQFNDKGIEAAKLGKEIQSGMIQGGHITHRHTDYDLALTYADIDNNNLRYLSCTKTRGTAKFSNKLLRADLSVGRFQEVKDNEIQ